MYDIIGDLHGYADELEMLLLRMGYQRIDGVWQHSERTLISVGDLIDRGPQQKRTVDILRAMAEKGFAKVIMGNHEFNAVAYATHNSKGQPMRPHTAKNRLQHSAFLNEAEPLKIWYHETINWFKQLPIILDLPELRVVHACWHQASISVIKEYCSDNYKLKATSWELANNAAHPLYQALEVLMKGWELPLPAGYSFEDKDGHTRDKIRTKWWLEQHGYYRDMAIGVTDISILPDLPVLNTLMPGYDNNKLLFIGHYWLQGKPSAVSPYIACVDYSVAEDGALVAYRFDGSTFSDANFVAVRTRPIDHFTAEQLNEALYLADPMNTCCKENECFDEYQSIARHCREMLDDNMALFDAIKQALVSAFDEDWVSDKHVSDVLLRLSEISDER